MVSNINLKIEDDLEIALKASKKAGDIIMKYLSLIHISEPTRPRLISYAVFCLKINLSKTYHFSKTLKYIMLKKKMAR